MIRRPPRSTQSRSSAASDVYKRQILFLSLAATTRGLLRDRAVRGVAVSLLVLFALHVLAVVVNVEAFYATRLGAWSAAHYGPFSRNLWATAMHFWRLVGCYCLLYTSDAADDLLCVDLGGRRI